MCVSAIVLLAVLTACGSDRSTPTQALPPAHHTIARVAPSPTASPIRPRPDTQAAGSVMGDPQARLSAFGVVPVHPERRAATWYVCRDPRCHHRTSAAVVTSDGFRHRAIVDLPVRHDSYGYAFQPAGPAHFVVTVNAGHPRLVDLRGGVRDITVGGTTGPLAPGEVAVGGKALRQWLAVDPDTGVAHPLSTPRDTVELATEPGGQLRVLTIHMAYLWSDDGGASWHRMRLPAEDRGLMAGMVPTTDDSLHALQLGGDGATLFPWDRVLKSTDGRTWTSYDGPDDPKGYGNPVTVAPDGRLVLDLVGWSDARIGRPSSRRLGLYAGADWARLEPVAPASPFLAQDSPPVRSDHPRRRDDHRARDDLRAHARRVGAGRVSGRRRELATRPGPLIPAPASALPRLLGCRRACLTCSSRSGASWSPAGCRRSCRSRCSTSWRTVST